MKKVSYIKCPRCELNYIKSTERYCPVCMAELKLAGEAFEHFEDEDELELCPICGQNFISPDQKCCEECARGRCEDEDDTVNVEDDEVEIVPLSTLAGDEFEDDDDEESEEEDSVKPGAFTDEDEYDLALDNLDDLDDDDLDEEDEDDDEDEDDEDDDE